MPSWRDEYLASIRDAERNDPVNRALVEVCSQMQDRVAALEADLEAGKVAGTEAVSATPAVPARPKPKSQSQASDDASTRSDPFGLAKLRLDLAESLRAQGQLQSRLRNADEELERLRAQTADDFKALRLLTAERNALTTKVRDRDEELWGKSKLVENVQDELLALTLQLNVAEQQKAKIQGENKELIDRWMKRMGQEADALNLANEPVFTTRP